MLSFDRLTIDVAKFRWLGKKSWSPLLHDISLDIKPGEMVALVGGSGEGKSLLLQSGLGLLPDNMRSHGNIILNGRELTEDVKPHYRGSALCYIPQGVSALNPLIRIGAQLERAAVLSGQHIKMHDIAHHLQQYNLHASLVKNYPRTLSGGMAKRVLACTATLSQAEYILADEISSWLDDEHAIQLLEHMKTLCRDGRGILWVTHDLAMAVRFADRIALLRNGTLEDVLSSQELKQGGGGKWLQSLWNSLPEHQFMEYR
ncbi:ATP-binding cassette domain-containing protein [Providencia sneebia]|uniref:Nickel/di-oligopepetide ABC transporter ATP-binding protein n=1 Tax=Providencia sneebia DSM 19967 TaxID=1141660 RepID=K8W7K3_9GAMM|nr:ATP-binding cassette domain-containing protein [Providencia sneebia]EKT53427.1 nickel/di-oligopepetide ABC transporter ATP-binding protein [Providencia sneebia DSM 19967]